MKKKIFAVVVTYKRPDILKNCLNSLLISSTRIVDNLHIVVNSDDPETVETINSYTWNSRAKITYEKFANIGPAGGFHEGIKKFLKSDCDYVWLLDDDIIVWNDCLDTLVNFSKVHPYIFSKVLKPSGEEVKAFGWWGVLISRGIVERVGLPIKDFFYWTEDTEYLQNRMIRQFGIIPVRCEEAVVTHLHRREASRPSWFYYYTVRNTLYYRMRIFPLNFKGRLILIKMSLGLGFRIFFKEPKKIKKIKYFLLGIIDAWKGKLGKLDHLHREE